MNDQNKNNLPAALFKELQGIIPIPSALLTEKAAKALEETAESGNVEAIKELQKVQARLLFNERMNDMDDDEYSY